ncbi:hypothetical protein [Falsibacillus albus]|uniref:hypothetical protein n=1 Tax=Falsibacillus albus TaxID=2478915 RepID=UPI001314B959|nr:hypothetical protein [Falsibacillus albus]
MDKKRLVGGIGALLLLIIGVSELFSEHADTIAWTFAALGAIGIIGFAYVGIKEERKNI